MISNYLLREVNSATEREQIAVEIVRILKPGGHVALADFIFTNACANDVLLNSLNASEDALEVSPVIPHNGMASR